MLIEIQDDFDLEKIALSGQCFRVKQFADGVRSEEHTSELQSR